MIEGTFTASTGRPHRAHYRIEFVPSLKCWVWLSAPEPRHLVVERSQWNTNNVKTW